MPRESRDGGAHCLGRIRGELGFVKQRGGGRAFLVGGNVRMKAVRPEGRDVQPVLLFAIALGQGHTRLGQLLD